MTSLVNENKSENDMLKERVRCHWRVKLWRYWYTRRWKKELQKMNSETLFELGTPTRNCVMYHVYNTIDHRGYTCVLFSVNLTSIIIELCSTHEFIVSVVRKYNNIILNLCYTFSIGIVQLCFWYWYFIFKTISGFRFSIITLTKLWQALIIRSADIILIWK